MVMIILKRDWQFWYTIMALHKLGAVTIPATHLFDPKDITYRVNAAGVKGHHLHGLRQASRNIDDARDVPTLKYKLLCGDRDSWLNYEGAWKKPARIRPPRAGSLARKRRHDAAVLHVRHHRHAQDGGALVHIPAGPHPTAVFWHNADPDGLHLTVSETGWAKSVWGKLYGHWLAETAIFVYDHEKFVPAQMLKAICEHKVTTFCAPPTVYRYFIKEDLSQYDFSHMKWATTASEPLNRGISPVREGHRSQAGEIYGQTG